MRLFVEKPRNKQGYRLYSAVVIGGEIEGDKIIIQEPTSFFEHEPRCVALCDFQEVNSEAGPPRMPSIQETQGDSTGWRNLMIERFAI